MISADSRADLDDLKEAAENSYAQMARFRANALLRLKSFVGSHYTASGSSSKKPINLLELAINIYRRGCVPHTPGVIVVPDQPELMPEARTQEIVLTRLLRDIGFAEELDVWFTDAMIGHGILQHGIAECEQEANWLADMGQPFVSSVSMDDWVHDMTAKRWSRIAFCGHDLTLPYDYCLNSGIFDRKSIEHAGPDEPSDTNEDGSQRRSTVGKGQSPPEPLYEEITLRQFWLPFKGQIVTVTREDFVQVRPALKYDGPASGPYERLVFTNVPDSTLPLPPTALWEDLDAVANEMFRKISRQASSKKGVVGYTPAGAEDAQRVLEAAESEWVKLASNAPIQYVQAGGIDQQTANFMIVAKELFSYFAGNLDVLGGLSPQANTLGQEQMLGAASSQRMNDMRQSTQKSVKRVVEAIAYYRWTDPFKTDTVRKNIPGTQFGVKATFGPQNRLGHFRDYQYDIIPYSMSDMTPGERLRTLANGFQTFIAPLLALLPQQGRTVNMEALVSTLARYTGMPEWEQIIVAVPRLNSGEDAGPRMAGNTTRNYVRQNLPGRARVGADQVIGRALIGGQSAAREQNQAVRTGA